MEPTSGVAHGALMTSELSDARVAALLTEARAARTGGNATEADRIERLLFAHEMERMAIGACTAGHPMPGLAVHVYRAIAARFPEAAARCATRIAEIEQQYGANGALISATIASPHSE